MAEGSGNQNRLYYADLGDPKSPDISAPVQAADRGGRCGVHADWERRAGAVSAIGQGRAKSQGHCGGPALAGAIGVEDGGCRAERRARIRRPHRRPHRLAVSGGRAEPAEDEQPRRCRPGRDRAAGHRHGGRPRGPRGRAGRLVPVQFAADAVHGLSLRSRFEAKRAVRGADDARRCEPVRNAGALRHVEGRHARAVLHDREEEPARDGSNPTMLYGYGGFSISVTPTYRADVPAWLEKGGVWVSVGLRGGAEYGEAWHKAGMLEKKQNVFDDFIAVAEHLVREKITSPAKLGVMGGSNGGLLVGAVVNQRPDLYAAALPAVGVMDMLRYERFTGGRFWVSEYGSAQNPEQFPFLIRYSPVQNITPGTCYPATLVTTADHDDRVVPSHSFKYAAALQAAQAVRQAGADSRGGGRLARLSPHRQADRGARRSVGVCGGRDGRPDGGRFARVRQTALRLEWSLVSEVSHERRHRDSLRRSPRQRCRWRGQLQGDSLRGSAIRRQSASTPTTCSALERRARRAHLRPEVSPAAVSPAHRNAAAAGTGRTGRGLPGPQHLGSRNRVRCARDGVDSGRDVRVSRHRCVALV